MALEFGGYNEGKEAPKSKLHTPYQPGRVPSNPENKEKLDDYALVIPSSLTGLEVGKGEVLAYEAPLMSHDINKTGNVCTYNLRGLVPINGNAADAQKIVDQFITHFKLFLKVNNVIDVQFGIGAGIGTSIAGTKYTGDYIARLTATFTLADPKKPAPNRITKIEGVSRYYVSSGTDDDKKRVIAAHQSNMGVFEGYNTIENTQQVNSQAALFIFGYKLNGVAATPVVNKPVVTNQPIGTYETPQGKLTLGAPVDRFSHEGAVCLPLLLDGMQVGSLVKCETKTGRKAQADFISAKASPQCFD
ncbi:MAG: hypothetical protein WC004_03435, partial [Candidatus Absconditabacterales bacterium]